MPVRADWSLLGILIVLGACQRPAAPRSGRDTVFVAGTKIGTAPPNTNEGEWSMPARDYANSGRRSRADRAGQRKEPSRLVDVLHRCTARTRRPALVVDNTMYIVALSERLVLDLTQPGFAPGITARKRAGCGWRRVLRRSQSPGDVFRRENCL
jgi:hypothetical protein